MILCGTITLPSATPRRVWMAAEPMTEDDVVALVESMSNWGRWGEEDQLGALNLITADKIRAAASLITEGRSVSLSRVVEFAPKPSRHEAGVPPIHFMQKSGEGAREDRGDAAYDWAGLPLHGHYVTHLDAHSHIFFNRMTYNGTPSSQVTSDRGALRAGIDVAGQGIVSRGVLLDIPRARGVEWLTGSDGVTPEDLIAAEDLTGVRCEAGDVILVRTGYGARRQGQHAGADQGLPGLTAECLPWIREREPAVIGSDTGTDQSPARFQEKLGAPVHLVCIVAMGMWVIDNCDLEAAATVCRELGRSSFMFSAAPLRLKNSTGSPFNPVAIF
jgi:kynurenine formamidase